MIHSHLSCVGENTSLKKNIKVRLYEGTCDQKHDPSAISVNINHKTFQVCFMNIIFEVIF